MFGVLFYILYFPGGLNRHKKQNKIKALNFVKNFCFISTEARVFISISLTYATIFSCVTCQVEIFQFISLLI